MDDLELENKTYKELVKVAKSLNIKANGTRDSLFSRIKAEIKAQQTRVTTIGTEKKTEVERETVFNTSSPQYQKEAIERYQQKQQIIEQHTHQINYDSLPDESEEEKNQRILNEILNDSNNSNQEKLFWKVYKNIQIRSIIYNYILSSNRSITSGSRSGIYKYSEVNNVEWMIKNKHYYLVRDKVFKSEKLVFKCSEEIIRDKTRASYNDRNYRGCNTYFKYSILSVFKDDIDFHRKLSNNYPLLFKTPYLIDGDLQRFAVEYDNVALMKMLVEDNNFTPKYSIFEQSIEIGSVNVAFYLFSKIDFNITKLQMDKLWKKILNYTPIDNNHNILNQRVDLFINKLKLQIPLESSLRTFKLFNFLIYHQSLELIIDCCKTVVYLKPLLDLITKDQSYEWLSIEELNELVSTFTEQELKEMEVGESDINDNRIKKLYNMLIIFTSDNIQNDQFYRAKYYKEFTNEFPEGFKYIKNENNNRSESLLPNENSTLLIYLSILNNEIDGEINQEFKLALDKEMGNSNYYNSKEFESLYIELVKRNDYKVLYYIIGNELNEKTTPICHKIIECIVSNNRLDLFKKLTDNYEIKKDFLSHSLKVAAYDGTMDFVLHLTLKGHFQSELLVDHLKVQPLTNNNCLFKMFLIINKSYIKVNKNKY